MFILIDDAGYDDFSFMGCKDWETPHIDSIAKKGVNFTNGYVTASVCGPSRAGLITGRYQQSFGHEENVTGGLSKPVPREKFGLPLEIPTLGKLLQKKGYTTSVFGKWHLGEHDHFHPNKRGFDHFVGFLGGHRSFWPLALDKAHNGHQLMNNHKVVKTPEYLTDHLGKQAVKFIDSNKNKPFFMYLAFNAVHSPLQATEADLISLAHITDKKRRVLGAMTIALDRSIGHVLDSLKKHGLENNTLIVFSNDNGAATYLKTNNGGLRGRKGTVWEGGLRVPFSASWKGHIKANTVCGTPVNTLDIGSTFCKLAGYSDAEIKQLKLPGTNLLELASGKQIDRALYWHRGNTSAIRRGDWKLISTKNKPSFLFNLTEDPKETKNLLKVDTKKTQNLYWQLQAWKRSLPEPLWTKKASNKYDVHLMKYWDQN
ncbi:MAG: sulfatase-like hydrolase/transferase [Akkermansiaceae bacterium]